MPGRFCCPSIPVRSPTIAARRVPPALGWVDGFDVAAGAGEEPTVGRLAGGAGGAVEVDCGAAAGGALELHASANTIPATVHAARSTSRRLSSELTVSPLAIL